MEHIFLGLLIGLGIYLAPVILAFFVVIIAVIVVGLEVFFEYLGKIFKKDKNVWNIKRSKIDIRLFIVNLKEILKGAINETYTRLRYAICYWKQQEKI